MGVSGCGKTTLGRALAQHLSLSFIDADDYHSPQSKRKMSQGIGLTDRERTPWLKELAVRLDAAERQRTGVVLACSALTQSYREILRCPSSQRALVHLTCSPEVLLERLQARTEHFAGPSLLKSQLQALESPGPEYEVHCRADMNHTLQSAIEIIDAQRLASTSD